MGSPALYNTTKLVWLGWTPRARHFDKFQMPPLFLKALEKVVSPLSAKIDNLLSALCIFAHKPWKYWKLTSCEFLKLRHVALIFGFLTVFARWNLAKRCEDIFRKLTPKGVFRFSGIFLKKCFRKLLFFEKSGTLQWETGAELTYNRVIKSMAKYTYFLTNTFLSFRRQFRDKLSIGYKVSKVNVYCCEYVIESWFSTL